MNSNLPIDKTTKAELLERFTEWFDSSKSLLTFDREYLINGLADLCLEMQRDTEKRVWRNLTQANLN